MEMVYALAQTWLPSTTLPGVIIHNQSRRKPKCHPDEKNRPNSGGGGGGILNQKNTKKAANNNKILIV
jgi:hypothetical protein